MQDIKSASASLRFNLTKVSNKCSGSTLAMSSSKSILKVLNDMMFIFFSLT